MEQLIIFDCDGVLVDSEFVSSKVFSAALSHYGYSISVEESIRRFTGIDEHSCRKIIIEESGLDIPVDYWAKSQSVLLKAFEMELVPLLKSLLEVLDSLNVARCLASNSSKNHISRCIGLTNQSKFFSEEAIFTAQQVSRPKPAPDLFLFAAKEMGFSPENCLVIEDSFTGIQAAKCAGMQVVGFLGGSHTQFDWYQQKIKSCNIPLAYSSSELLAILNERMLTSNVVAQVL